jgi:hypothetical protein
MVSKNLILKAAGSTKMHYPWFMAEWKVVRAVVPAVLQSGLNAVGVQVKDKVHSTTGHEGPEGEQTYISTLPLTLALYVSGWSMPCPGHFIPRERGLVLLVQEAGWAPGPV